MRINGNLLLILIGLFIGQSIIISGVNFSLSDIFLICYIIYLIALKVKWINTKVVIFYSLLVSYLLFTSIIITPILWNIETPFNKIIVELIKLTILFLYLNTGIYLYKVDKFAIVLKSFVFGSIIVSLIGIIVNFTNEAIKSYLFFGDYRFKGLLNDPNLFAVTQIIAISLLNFLDIKFYRKFLYFLILLIGIVLSGSKTGLICLILFLLLSFVKFYKKINFHLLIRYIFISIIILVLFYFVKDIVLPQSFLNSINRMSSLITDLTTSLNEGGSERGDAWGTALKIISKSLLLGIGLGNYLIISEEVYNVKILAHNTYLQCLAEWGILFTLIFFLIIILKLIIIFLNKKYTKDYYLGELIIYFLMGSFALSLNNSRLFWFILGPFLIIKITKNYHFKKDER
ncbi:O-antigen ligase family protein [Macrococcoides caseolyticum]|uniref:O-antigen ligase family protein n=1 Tax=Macrococcoides caseolyticum TaxID=69966 RepID=UPI00105EC5C4|nr:O-antigen ligase family protein [Macrococcus caseolyticus]TDM19511.1 hypothetical protein ETI00_01830 [Macrococcus caseolyticus]VUC67801.1 O-Antigen ligase family protein [Macrococcus caseolyticus]